MNEIRIEYDGSYPNLCSGKLIVFVDGVKWEFPNHCMCSGGSVSFGDDWQEEVTSGPWSIDQWPEYFPEELQLSVIDAVNSQVTWGCCGGCV